MTTSAPGSDPQPTPSTNAYRSTNAGPNKNANTGTSADDRTPQAVLQQLLDGNDRFVQGEGAAPAPGPRPAVQPDPRAGPESRGLGVLGLPRPRRIAL